MTVAKRRPGKAVAVLFDTRVALHRVTGRATERLALQDQDAVAEQLGVRADDLMRSVAGAARIGPTCC